MNVSGPVALQTGSVGVNGQDGTLAADRDVPIQLNAHDGVIAARKASLLEPSNCTSAAFFANTIPGNAAEQCGSAQSQAIPDGQPPLVPDIRSSPICVLPPQFPNFPKCDDSAPVTVDAGAERSLPPGTYGDLTVSGTLRLEGGVYVFCNATTNDGSQVFAAASSTLLVADALGVLPNSQINVGRSPQDLRVLVNGKHDAVNIAGGSRLVPAFGGQPAVARLAPRATTTCSFHRPVAAVTGVDTTVVVAQLCALGKPATLNLFNAAILGTFIADEIHVGDVAGGSTAPPTTSSTSTTSPTSTSSTSTSTSSTSTSTSGTSTSTSSTSTSSTSAPTTSTSTTSSTASTSSTTSTSSTSTSSTSSTIAPTTTSTSTSTSTTVGPPTTSVPTSTSTTTSASVPGSTSTSTSSSTSAPSTTSTSLPPPCYPLRLTSLRLKPRKNDPSKGSLKVRGVLADAGWAGVDPKRSGVDLAVARVSAPSTCCTVEQQHWMKPGPTEFKFWDMHRTVCPPLTDMRIHVSRKGHATFRFFAPRVDLTPGGGPELTLGAIVGTYCSVGSVPSTSFQQKKNGGVVYP